MRFPKLRHVPLRDSPEEQLEFNTFLQLCKSADDEIVDENTLIKAQHAAVAEIPDEKIEESFPLTAEDAAEMDAAEDFVETLAWLSYLDDREEAARFSYLGRGKRFAARRRAGLLDKPHPAKPRHPRDDGSAGTVSTASDASSVAPRAFEVMPRNKVDRGGWGAPRNPRGMQHRDRNRQQPRPKFVAHKAPTRGKRGRAPAQSNRLGGHHMA